MPPSRYKESVSEAAKPPQATSSNIIAPEEVEHPTVEFLDDTVDDSDEEKIEYPIRIVEPSIIDDSRGRKPKPVDLSVQPAEDEDLIITPPPGGRLSSSPLVDFSVGQKSTAPKTPTWNMTRSTNKILTSARPDKETFRAILDKKKQSELEKKIGKEPGADQSLDFEDFMNLIRQNRK
jgi:hypothetical protein